MVITLSKLSKYFIQFNKIYIKQARPYGVGLLIGGIDDNGACLY